MTILSVSFEEIGGATICNGMSLWQANPVIINLAADFLDEFRFFGAGIDNFTDYKKVKVNWPMRCIEFPIVLE